MPDEHAPIHSPLGYLRDAMGITIPNSLNILSDTSAVTFFGFFNFVFSPWWKGCSHGPLLSRKRVNFRRWRGQITIVFNSSFVTPDKPAWLRINFHSGKLSTLCDAVSLLPAAPTLTSRCVTSRSNVAKGESQQALTACYLVPHICQLLSKRCTIYSWFWFSKRLNCEIQTFATLPFKSTQMDSNETNSLTDWIDLISLINRSQIISFLGNKQSSRQGVHFLLKVLAI